MQSESPPEEFIDRARAKMDSVRNKGDVSDYMMFEQRFIECWKRMRQLTEVPMDAKVNLTLAAGAPALPWLVVESSAQDKVIAAVTIKAPSTKIIGVRLDILEIALQMKLAQLGIFAVPHAAQVHAMYLRACSGEPITRVPLNANPDLASVGNKPYAMVANKIRKELMVVIADVQSLREKAGREAMFALINQAVKQMNTTMPDTEFKLQKNDFAANLQNALVGPEFLGVESPLVLLAAIGVKKVSQKAQAIVENYPGAGRLQINVSKDRLEAAVTDFEMAWYDGKEFQVSVEWLEKELQRLGLITPMGDDLRKAVSDAITQKVDLTNMPVAQGDLGAGGRSPYLHPCYRDAQARVSGDLDVDDLDIREIQQRSTVRAGQLIAEIRYEEPPVPGKSVFGEDLEPPPNDELVVRIGDGVIEKKKGKYYALSDGLPTLDNESITLSKVLVHEGDVNLRTGNIRFDGPVEIKGSIDSGAVVETTGDLIVHGTIRSAFVKSAGSIAVKTGIVTGPKGRVYAVGNVQADFIENSNITCGGDLTVKKALLNCQVVCGGRILVSSSDGLVAGGNLSCKDALRTPNLGFRNGSITVLGVGVDWRVQNSIRIREMRLDRIKEMQVADRGTLREIVQKSKAQMTSRHKEMKERLQLRLQKTRGLIERLEQHLNMARARLSYNEEARIFVMDQLSLNTAITIAGQAVSFAHDMAGIGITPKRRKGSFIQPIEDVEAKDGSEVRGAS